MNATFHEIYNGKLNQRDSSVQPLLKRAQKKKSKITNGLASEESEPQETLQQNDLEITAAI
jgi:hypothetical protein